jgi:phenylalanyl-tRNA synthetase beta chain
VNASYEWLKAFVPTDATPGAVRDLLTAHMATVEELVPLRVDLAPIVIARVVEAGRHPDSDHLWLTKVDAGGGELLEVVCGAPNVTAGGLYPFAPVGTTMPSGIKIERRKIRGIVSNGMLCSAKELGLGENSDGILELDLDAEPGTRFLSAMPVGDMQLVIDVGPNRSDLQSHLGIARELAAIAGVAWHLPEIPGLGPATLAATVASGQGTTAGTDVRVDDDTRTRRYMVAVVRGVKIGPSADWLVKRLASVGVRPINNVVDATNYVLHELGQPVHAFDLAKLSGGVVVRRARAKEQIVTLDGVSRSLPAGAVVIADATRAHAAAGVMGGKDSEVTDATRDLLIEVASFDPKLTRSTRRALALSSDASFRFERGVDPAMTPVALDRVVRLIISLAGGSLADAPLDLAGPAAKPLEITLRVARTTQVLGVEVPVEEIRRHLGAAGFGIVSHSAREVRVRVPTWRTDVHGEVDLIEEVARFHGYDRFPDEIRPYRPSTTRDDPMWGIAARVRRTLAGLGIHEARPMPFVAGADETHVRVGNPLSESEGYLRGSVLESLARRAEHNLSHRVGDVRLFEIGSVFGKATAAMPVEELRVGIVLMGQRRPAHFSEPQPPNMDAWDAKAVADAVAHAGFPGTAESLVPAAGDQLWDIVVDGKIIGSVGRLALDAPVWAAPAFGIEISLSEVVTVAPAPRGQHRYMEGAGTVSLTGVFALAGVGTVSAKFKALPTMPVAEFDLALLVPQSLTVGAVERVIREAAGELLESLLLFDEYTGAGVSAGHRSLAWRLTFRHPERTLRDKEIDGRRTRILRALEEELNVRQRTT